MIVSHKYRFIFMRTEKTAGSSLTEAMGAVLGDGDMTADLRRPAWAKYSPIHHGALKRKIPDVFGLHPHATARQARRVLGKKVFDSYLKFAVERNPWDRQVSLYFHRAWKKKTLKPNFDRDIQSFFYRNSEYVRLNNWSMYTIANKVVVDRVLRYENLFEDIKKLAQDLKLKSPIQLPNLRKYTADRPHYSTFYSDQSRRLIAKWYAREIDALGYQFEPLTAGENHPNLVAWPS